MRLFIAVSLSNNIKTEILKYRSQLMSSASGNFSPPENLHITLAFIGEYSDPKPVLDAIKSVSFAPFDISLSGSGRFGSLYWLGLKNEDKLKQISDKVRYELKKRNVPFDSKPFKAHITVAREVKLNKPFTPHYSEQVLSNVNSIHLMKSERINGRMVYTEIK